MMAILADGFGSPLDQGVTTILLLGAAFLAWVAVARLRGRAYRRLPRRAAWAAAVLAVVSVALAFVLTPILRPNVASARPSTAARLAILSPTEGQVFLGNPALVPVRLGLTGGRVVAFTSSKLVPNEGHVHLYLDGALVSMSLSLEQDLHIAPGSHVLRAEFVAVDHAPFDPRVVATASFTVSP